MGAVFICVAQPTVVKLNLLSRACSAMVAFARAEAGLFLSLSSLNPIKQDLAYNQIKPYHLIKSI